MTKSIAMIENIYFSINIFDEIDSWNQFFEKELLFKFDSDRQKSLTTDFFISDGIQIIKGIQRYNYGFKVSDSDTEKYRIYISSKIGDNYPIYVIVSAQYLHLLNVFSVIDDVKYKLQELFSFYIKNFIIQKFQYKISRIDICNHNTLINLDNYILPSDYNSRVSTKIRKVFSVIDLVGDDSIKVPYYRYGSGDICIRFYNKVQEIIEMRYKSFFFLKWLNDGLIDIRTKDIYENAYKLNKSYNLDFLYSHFIVDSRSNLIESNFLEDVKNIYNDENKNNDEKYDIIYKILKREKIKIALEVVNVEFQLRHEFLKSLKILKPSTGELIDYTDIYDLFAHIDILYQHLTESVFRVVNKDDKKKRKRNKETDTIWFVIQKSEIKNVDIKYVEDTQIYRQYQSKMNKLNTCNKIISNMAHLYYQNIHYINKDTVLNIDIDDFINDFRNEYSINENYLNLQDRLLKQIKYYGKKNVPREDK